MYLIKDIYYVYIYLLLGILKLKKGIKLILFLEMYVKKLEKKISGVCWILFLYKYLFKFGDWKICIGILVKIDITIFGFKWLFRFCYYMYCIYFKMGIFFLNNCFDNFVWY